MKKAIYLCVLMLMITSCGEPKETLKILMWTDNIPQDVYNDFTKETGIEIIEDAMTSNEEAYAKVKASTSSYDVIAPSLDYAEIMMKEGLLSTIDKSIVTNIDNIDKNILSSVKKIDANIDYIVPFAFGPTVIAYDSTKVTNEIANFDIFTNTAYSGKSLLLNDMREVMGSALLTLGYALDETNAQAMQEVSDLLRSWKENVLRFDSDAFQIAYANGEVDIIQGYVDTIIPALSEEKLANTKFVVPNKGGIMWIDNFLVLKDAPNPTAAMKFIEFIHRPEIYARIMDYIGSLSLNAPAREFMEVQSPVAYEDLENVSMLTAISDEALSIHSRVWENIQAQ